MEGFGSFTQGIPLPLMSEDTRSWLSTTPEFDHALADLVQSQTYGSHNNQINFDPDIYFSAYSGSEPHSTGSSDHCNGNQASKDPAVKYINEAYVGHTIFTNNSSTSNSVEGKCANVDGSLFSTFSSLPSSEQFDTFEPLPTNQVPHYENVHRYPTPPLSCCERVPYPLCNSMSLNNDRHATPHDLFPSSASSNTTNLRHGSYSDHMPSTYHATSREGNVRDNAPHSETPKPHMDKHYNRSEYTAYHGWESDCTGKAESNQYSVNNSSSANICYGLNIYPGSRNNGAYSLSGLCSTSGNQTAHDSGLVSTVYEQHHFTPDSDDYHSLADKQTKVFDALTVTESQTINLDVPNTRQGSCSKRAAGKGRSKAKKEEVKGEGVRGVRKRKSSGRKPNPPLPKGAELRKMLGLGEFVGFQPEVTKAELARRYNTTPNNVLQNAKNNVRAWCCAQGQTFDEVWGRAKARLAAMQNRAVHR